MQFITDLKSRVKQLQREIFVLHLAVRDPRTPWYAKAFIVCVVAYALSPIDLIPDFIPLLGYVDDLLLLPLGIFIAVKMIPKPILAQCRQTADASNERLPRNWLAAGAIALLWIAAFMFVGSYLLSIISEFMKKSAWDTMTRISF